MDRNSARLALVGSTILYLSGLSISPGLFAAPGGSTTQEAVSDDGRDVLLKDDGTWEFRSNDRYANTPDGRRVRLKQDNTWEYIGNAPLTTKTQARTSISDISLQRAVIEMHQEEIYKNVRTETQTVFYLKVALSAQADKGVTLDKTTLGRIKVTDNQGARYPILSLAPERLTLAPNSQQDVTVRVDGSPSWWKGIKSMQLELAPGVFGNRDTVALTMPVNDMDRTTVEGFPTP